jgi:cytochrome b6-f complex iron-sulfur subunit
MDRRTFLYWAGTGALASSLPVAIAACSPDNTATKAPDSATATRPNGFSVVGTLKDLDQMGVIQDKAFAAGALIVVRDATDSTQLTAVNATCPHQGCTVDWQAQSKQFTCPCHGSKFKPDGSVVNGPAINPLPTFTVKTEGDSILVKGT